MIIENNQIRWIGFAIGVEQANIIFFPGLNLIKIYRKNVLCMLMINMNMQCEVQEKLNLNRNRKIILRVRNWELKLKWTMR